MEVENTLIISILLMILSLALGLLINSLLNINNKLSEIHHCIKKGELNPDRFSEVKEEIIELKGMLNMLSFNQHKRDPPS
jgi:hypothetical protein